MYFMRDDTFFQWFYYILQITMSMIINLSIQISPLFPTISFVVQQVAVRRTAGLGTAVLNAAVLEAAVQKYSQRLY